MAKGKGFGMGPMGGMGGMNMNNLMKQAQKMQKQMEEAQAALAEKVIAASAGGGAVKVEVSGKKELLSVTIDPEVVDPDDVEMLQDLILSAVNEGLRQADEVAAGTMGRFTGGLM